MCSKVATPSEFRGKDPWMLEFIRVAKIAHIIGDILFLHGGICTESYGQVPSRDGRCRDVQEWVTWRQVSGLQGGFIIK